MLQNEFAGNHVINCTESAYSGCKILKQFLIIRILNSELVSKVLRQCAWEHAWIRILIYQSAHK